MNRCSLRLALVAAAFATFACSASCADDLALPKGKAELFALRELRTLSAGMQVTPGTIPAEKEAAIRAPRHTKGGLEGGNPALVADFCRFLQNGMTQSYNKSYQEAYEILSTHVKNALEAAGDGLPLGIETAVRTGRKASYEKSWKAGWEILHTAVKAVVDDPYRFQGDRAQVFAALLSTGRQCSYDKSYQEAYGALKTFYDDMIDLGVFNPNRATEVTFRAARQASYNKSWQDGWNVLHTAAKGLEGIPYSGTDGMKIGLQCSFDKSYQAAYEILKAFYETFIANPGTFSSSFQEATLKSSLEASYNKSWQTGWEILRDGVKALQ